VHECILSLGDNTLAIGWIFRSTQLPQDLPYYLPVPLISRKVALLISKSQQGLCSQHLKGESNNVPDWLSFTDQTQDGKQNPVTFDNPADDLLTHRFHSSVPQLIPQHFKISPLPDKILSFVEPVLQTTKLSMIRYSQRQTKTGIAPGDGGLDTANKLSKQERELLLRSFISTYQVAHWHQSGQLLGTTKKALVGASVRTAAGHLAAAFWDNFKSSPLHVSNGSRLLPSFSALFKALDNIGDPPNQQWAIMPKFLRYLHQLGSPGPPKACALDHAVDLLIAGFFFATRPCKIVRTKNPGRTKTIELRHIVFRDASSKILPHTDQLLLQPNL
jgi:hypothetical protein